MAFDGYAKFFKREFCVVAGARGFADGSVAFGKQPRQEDGGLDLRARHWHLVMDATEFAATDFEWSKIVVASGDLCAHFTERGKDALHGSLVERLVAGDFAGEALACEDAGK